MVCAMSNPADDLALAPRGAAVPSSTAAHKGRLYAVFVAMAIKGCSLTQALHDGGIARSTYYSWEENYPGWVGAVREEALQFATEEIKTQEQQLAVRRLAVQRQVDELILEGAETVVKEQITLATKGESELAKLGAAKALQKFAIEGFVYHKSAGTPEVARADEGMPYNPHDTIIDAASIQIPPGSKVHVDVETPDVIEVLPGGGTHTPP